jgi:hypothetical protein
MVIPTFSESSVTLIFRLANITSIFIAIAMIAAATLLDHFLISCLPHFGELFEKQQQRLQ